MLGFIFGLQYKLNTNFLPGTCYETIELNIILINEMLALVGNLTEDITKFSNLALVYNDLVDVAASIQANCNIEDLIT